MVRKNYHRKKKARQRKNYRGAGLSHLKNALEKQGMKSTKRIGRHLFNQRMGKCF